VLEAALSELGWKGSSLRAAGRTDSGVHAKGQVVCYSLQWSSKPERLTSALNAHLPEDVAVRHTEVVPDDFDPRFGAVRRSYIYRLLIDSAPDPLVERTAWRVWPEPNLDHLHEAADLFVGKKDFGAFGQAPRPDGHTVRTISRAEWQKDDAELRLLLEADAFLYRMVRRITAANLQVGKGERELEDIESSLSDPAQKWTGRLAPAKGLCLETVTYEA
jgi:tRNA pseudouridine38-40 synthase